MQVLIVGGGGREHAIAWKCAQSSRVDRVFVAPGNAGTALEPKLENIDIPAGDIGALADFAARRDVALTIVGPEAPLVAGIVDRFNASGLACFGPTRAAARLEGSKAYTKEFLRRHRIPTARFATFTAQNFDPDFIRGERLPVVVKADGLAAGKGVMICETHEAAIETARRMLGGSFGAAGSTVVIEEFLHGEEVSFIVVVAGDQAVPLATSQDHKRRDDGDQGPNTGGMGAYSPAPLVTPELDARIRREVIEPTLRGLRLEGTPYTGFLYAGLMIAPDGTPNVLEFNCRLGDPETQAILLRADFDFAKACLAAARGELGNSPVRWNPAASICVVIASEGYPARPETGKLISGLDEAAKVRGAVVFHAGTRRDGNKYYTSGGRVLGVGAFGQDLSTTCEVCYDAVSSIWFDGAHHRSDVGRKMPKSRKSAKEGMNG